MDENIGRDFTQEKSVATANTEIIITELRDIFTIDEIKSEVAFWKINKEQPTYGAKQDNFRRICGLCLCYPKESKMLMKFRKTGLHRMKVFLLSSTRKEVQSKDIKLLIWCCLNLLAFFSSKQQEYECTCLKRQKLEECKTLYINALYLVIPEKQKDVIKYTTRYLTLTSLWNTDEFDLFVLQEILSIITKPELLIAKIIKQLEFSQKNEAVGEAFHISCTLSNILEHVHWDKYLFNHLLHNCFNTLLKMFLMCSVPLPSYLKLENVKLGLALKTCIKYFITNIKDNKGLVTVMDSIAKCLHDPSILEEDRREIMNMLVYCAQKHQTKYYRESLTPDCLELLLINFYSNDKILTMSSHKVMRYILDRHGNERNFIEPVYFFKGRSYFVINYDFSVEDTHFFKSFSQKFLDGINHCFLTFTEKYCLTSCYVILCIVLVEIPEPVITINVIHTLVTIQNDVLKHDDFSLPVRAQIHAIICALFSLICIIHENDVAPLKKYTEEVVRFRTENSPHLLPPLQNKYIIASHHTDDYYDELYFMEDEVLYALQRCWLGKRTGMSSKG